MRQEQVQILNEKKIFGKLDRITELLEIVVGELESKPTKLSKKAEKALDRGIKELRSGKYAEYKDFESFRKAVS